MGTSSDKGLAYTGRFSSPGSPVSKTLVKVINSQVVIGRYEGLIMEIYR